MALSTDQGNTVNSSKLTEEHLVSSGDSLSKIALKNKAALVDAGVWQNGSAGSSEEHQAYLTALKLAENNKDRYPGLAGNPNAIKVGWTIKLYDKNPSIVQKNSQLSKIEALALSLSPGLKRVEGFSIPEPTGKVMLASLSVDQGGTDLSSLTIPRPAVMPNIRRREPTPSAIIDNSVVMGRSHQRISSNSQGAKIVAALPNVKVWSSSGSLGQRSNQTGFEGVHVELLGYIEEVAKDIQSMGIPGDVIITGLAENGHAPNGHGLGIKADIDDNPTINRYVRDKISGPNPEWKQVSNTWGQGTFEDVKRGVRWVREGNHYDLRINLDRNREYLQQRNKSNFVAEADREPDMASL